MLLGETRSTLQPLNFADTARQFLDDLVRQAGRQSGPSVGRLWFFQRFQTVRK
jgi:hypothetical protein